MKLSLKWEFPAGKKEGDETDEECLQHEILEELNIKMNVLDLFASRHYEYPDVNITSKAYNATFITETLLMFEYRAIKCYQRTPLSNWTGRKQTFPS